MRESTKREIRRFLCFCLTFIMILTSMPVHLLAANVDHSNLLNNKSEIINSKLPVNIAKPEAGQSAEGLIKNPDQKAIYTWRHDYKTKKGEKYEISYQPYIASVGEAATPDQQKKVKKEITLPNLAGYEKPIEDSFTIDYDTVKNKANGNNKTGNVENGFRFKAKKDHKYTPKSSALTIKHTFQDLNDFTRYTNLGGDDQPEKITTQNGNTGSAMEATPLEEKDRRGFVPEAEHITLQVPEDPTGFVLEYRYNRAYYAVDFDTDGGTPLPSRTCYYDQQIPKIEPEHMPKKEGSDFLGWKPSHPLKDIDGNEYKEGEIIKKDGKPALDLDVNLKMPALDIGKSEDTRERLKFTAVWKDKEKADYAVQYWAEKSDHDDNASLLDKYDYMGTRVYKDQTTGMRPDLDNQPIKDIPFPDLDQARLTKIWEGGTFDRGSKPLLSKFYTYNKNLTHEQNKDPKQPTMVKSVSSTGKTVYNIYYDRQVYDLYFTKSNALDDVETFVPSIYVYDKNGGQNGKGGAKLAGGPGNPYHFKARFNQLMLDWPNDAMQTKGFTPGMQSYGWGPNTLEPWWDFRDTPPYRLSADQFLDFSEYNNKGGYTKTIDKGDGSSINLSMDDFTTLSFGIKQGKNSIPHHMDFWMDGFKPEETIIRYDLYRSKADTNSKTYGHKYTVVQGFTAKKAAEKTEFLGEYDVDDKNDDRKEVTPFPDKKIKDMYNFEWHLGEMKFIQAFFNNADPYGDPLTDEDGNYIVPPFKTNGYLRFKYTRNKYPLRFNYDPSKTKGDNEFNKTNSLDTFYEFPLKVLSPNLVEDTTKIKDREYFKEDPKNFLDDPENLKKLGLTDLVFNDPNDGKLKVKRPDGLSAQMVFKGWALDPAGTKLVWENPKEKMPNHAVNLYAKWGEPDSKWKVTFDPNGGTLANIKEENLTTERKTIQEGDIGKEEQNTYAKKGYLKEAPTTKDGKQIFTVIQRQKLVAPRKPVRKGYDFMGWEVIRYKKDKKGDYTDEVDESYRKTYGVPELYTFGNDVVSPITLKAIWNKNEKVDVKVVHHFLDKDGKKNGEPLKEELEDKRTGYYTATVGDQQGEKWILATHEELMNSKDPDIKQLYEKYDKDFGFKNNYFQNQRIQPKEIKDSKSGKMIPNPDYKGNEFHFFYRPFRKREYKVNFIDERYKGKPNEKEGTIIGQELVSNGNRHFDARNYRPIPGWKLVSDPQQQLFFDVDEDTNQLKGINGTGSDEITFYYKDVRVIEVPKDEPVPEGYVRVTFKADKGGSFTDSKGNSVTELHYDVIKGLKSDLLPVPQELKDGETKSDNKQYITPETGKKFVKWDEKPLLNNNTILENEEKDYYEFTAKFEWSGLSTISNGLVRTEAYNDPNKIEANPADPTVKAKDWSNKFAPTIEDLKKQLVWKEKDQVKPLPEGTTIEFVYKDDAGKETKINTDEDVFNLVKEMGKEDKDEVVRVVNIVAKVTFKDGKQTQELPIPITVYKNRYEALNENWQKPKYLSDAEGKEAKDGGLKDVTGNYVKVTVAPTGDMTSKDNKVYYVNPNAWVEIPEAKPDGSSTFVNWTADVVGQNDDGKANGKFDFAKRHKFTTDTVIKPIDAKDVVEQKDPTKKPNVPGTYVKVIVKTTDKATDDTKFEKTFWVNPTKEVTIDVTNPTGKTVAADSTKPGTVGYKMDFFNWKSEETTPRTWKDKIVGKFEKETTIIAKYSVEFEKIKETEPTKGTVDVPKGKTPTDDEIKNKLTPPEGKTIKEVKIVENPDVNNPGESKVKVIVEYTDGSSVGTNDKPVEVPVKVHEPVVKSNPDGSKPEKALENYVKVTFKAGTGGSVSGDLVYYVSPEVEVNMTSQAEAVKKTPDVGYTANGGTWSPEIKAEKITAEKTYEFNFVKSKDIVEKIDDSVKKPEGYVTVKFIAGENGEVVGGNKTYYVNPEANIKLVDKDKATQGATNELVVPQAKASDNYGFTGWVEKIDYTNPIKGDREHVAKFKLAKVTLTYEAGEGAKGEVPAKVEVDHGTNVRLARPDKLSKDNAIFAGWKIGATTYQAGDQVTLNENTTATAQWTTNNHTVTFDTQGGNKVDSQQVEHGKTATEPKSPTQDGKVFMGWKEKETDTTYFDFNTPIKENKTLIAMWQDSVQNIDEKTDVESQFIKVTFKEGKHGKLKLDDAEQTSPVIYKVAKDLTFDQAKAAGLKVPEIAPAKYYKATGWDNALKLNGQNVEFTAQYEPQADVIPVDPEVTDEDQIQKEKPDGMVLVTFVVPEDKAFMTGETKFYVKKNQVVDIDTPVVHPLTLDDGKENDYEFNGWNFNKDSEGNYVFTFDKDTQIDDGNVVKPEIEIRNPRPNQKNIVISKLTDGATGYLEVTRGSNPPVLVKSTKRGRFNIFVIPSELGGKLNRNDTVKIYSKLDNLVSDKREYRVR